MRSLLVMRHAKSDWSTAGQEDFDRPLNKRGRKDARRVSRFLTACAFPDLILASAAVRAHETATRVAEDLEEGPQLVTDGRLYLAAPEILTTVVATTAGAAGRVLAIAHNPGMEDWLTHLTGARVRFPPAAVARVDFDMEDWQDLPGKRGILRWMVTPKLLRGEA